MEKVANWKHNSGKEKKGHGRCKGRVRASKQVLRNLKVRLTVPR